MSAFLTITGVKELDDALSYLRDKSAKRIGKAASRRMATVLAKGIRAQIPSTIAKSMLMGRNRGIGSRGTKGKMSNISAAKAGVGVGKVQKDAATIVNRGKKKGVGVSARNLHWFAAGTTSRYTGIKLVGRKGKRRKIKTGNPVRFTGKIDRLKWGGFVQKGATAMRSEAIQEAAKTVNRMIAAEWKAAKGEGSPIQVQFDD